MNRMALADHPKIWPEDDAVNTEEFSTPKHDLPIRLERVSKNFGQRQVLLPLDLKIPAGQFLAVIGRSGCGKTTLLRLIAGLERVSSGAVFVGESRVGGLQRRVRMLFQDARLLNWQSVLKNVGIARGQGWQERALKALREVNLLDRAKDWPSVLSGGQKQRVSLARALVSEPDILLLDEPFGALDALTRLEMHELLTRIWLENRFTTVLITHDVSEAVALADRVMVLRDGVIALDISINLPRSSRALGDAATGRLQAEILRHV
jgi:sulfonate transport system ATP-binding protein